MAFKHKATSYMPGPAPNPFQKGQDRAYGDILAHLIKEKNFWRNVVGSGILVLSFFNLMLFLASVKTQKTVPVLVNVMPSGEAVNLGEVRQSGDLQVPEAAILFQVRKFITNIRSISTDPEVLYNNINDCYYMATGSYEPVMTRMLRSASPFDLVGKARRAVEIETVLKTVGTSYQADWIETTFEAASGGSPKSRKMRAVVTVKLLPPDSSFIKTNPLGIFIDNLELAEL